MKNILKLAIFMIAAAVSSSCYDSYLFDFEYPNMGFALPKQVRTVISDKNCIYVGVSIGGKREIDMNDWAVFMIDETLLEGSGKTLMPETYYTLSDPSMMRVSKNNIAVADVAVTFTDDFYADPAALTGSLAIPFRIIQTSIPAPKDSLGNQSKYGAIREGGQTAIVAVKYINAFSGTWYRAGGVVEIDANGDEVGEPVTYNNAEMMNNPTLVLKTKDRYTVTRPGTGALTTGGLDIKINEVEGASSYTLDITAATGTTLKSATGTLVLEGEYHMYNSYPLAPQMNLEYVYTDGGKDYKVSEKLVLRQWAERELKVETF